ncbi:MAG TPA: DUF4142 domain-containing protein, partial [Vicinamibacterales bacterium]|nr:DUF4142 domain-containing protein [Vicinamibacterales bacterium]
MKGVLFAGIALALATSAWAQSKPRNSTTQSGSPDLESILAAAQGGMAEVELGKVAVQQGTSEEVKKFGQRITARVAMNSRPLPSSEASACR